MVLKPILASLNYTLWQMGTICNFILTRTQRDVRINEDIKGKIRNEEEKEGEKGEMREKRRERGCEVRS